MNLDFKEYLAYSVPGEEIRVRAVGEQIVANKSGNQINFIIPDEHNVMFITLRIPGNQLLQGRLQIDLGHKATSWSDRPCPNIQAWRESDGTMIPITVTLDTKEFDKFYINNLVAGITNYVKLSF